MLRFIFVIFLSFVLIFQSIYPSLASAAVVNPPANPSSIPSPGATYTVSPQLEQQLSVQRVVFDQPLPGIGSSISFGGRTWSSCVIQELCKTQEVDVITTVQTVNLSDEEKRKFREECQRVKDIDANACLSADAFDLILFAGITSGVLAGVGVAYAGPAVAALVQPGAIQSVIFANAVGIYAAVNAGMLNAYTRFQSAPIWIQIAGNITLGFAELFGCQVVSQTNCDFYQTNPVAGAQQVRNGTRMYIPSTVIETIGDEDTASLQGLVTKAFAQIPNNVVGRFIKEIFGRSEVKGVPFDDLAQMASSLGFLTQIGKESAFGLAFRRGDEVLKLSKFADGFPIRRFAKEIAVQQKAVGIDGVLQIKRVVRVRDIPNSNIRQLYQSEGIPDDQIVGAVYEYVDGLPLTDYLATGGRLSQESINNFKSARQDLIRRTGQGLGDHFGHWGENAPLQDLFHWHGYNTRITPEGKLVAIDIGAQAATLEEEERIMNIVLNFYAK